MMQYGVWNETLEIEGALYPAELTDPFYAKRAGFAKIYAINGLPNCFENNLIRAAQVVDVPHTWRVQECLSEDAVTPEILQRGKAALDEDRMERGSFIIAYVGVKDRAHEFLAAGAIRDKLTKTYRNEQFPVVSRAVVAPAHRGQGLGSLIVEHRFKAVLNFFAQKPKAIHFGTESEKILQSIKKVERDEGLKYVHIGNEQLTVADGVHTVTDYLCFMPWYHKQLLEACDVLSQNSNEPAHLHKFKRDLTLFMAEGVAGTSGDALEHLFRNTVPGIKNSEKENIKQALACVEELFFVKQKIGAMDPSITP